MGCSNPHIAGVPSICGSCLTADPVTRRFYIVKVVLQFIRVPQPYPSSHSVLACPPRAHCYQPLLSLHLDSMGSQAGAHWGTLGHVPKQLRIMPYQCNCACQLSAPIVHLSSANWVANYLYNLALKIKNHSVANCASRVLYAVFWALSTHCKRLLLPIYCVHIYTKVQCIHGDANHLEIVSKSTNSNCLASMPQDHGAASSLTWLHHCFGLLSSILRIFLSTVVAILLEFDVKWYTIASSSPNMLAWGLLVKSSIKKLVLRSTTFKRPFELQDETWKWS